MHQYLQKLIYKFSSESEIVDMRGFSRERRERAKEWVESLCNGDEEGRR